MLGLIKRLFGGPDRLTRLAQADDRDAFADAFLKSDIWFLTIPPGLEAGIDPKDLTEQALIEQLEAAAKHVADRGEYQPFTYELDGVRCLPLFTSQANATEFVTQYVQRRNRIIPFGIMQVSGAAVAASLGNEAVILNDTTKHATRLSAGDVDRLREAAAAQK